MSEHGRTVDPLRTAVAARGVELSALFFVVFENFRVGGNPPRQPRLIAPPGPSTEGGKLSRQNITLVPVEGQSGPSIVAGWADSSTRRAELRTFAMVADAYQSRRGEPLEMSSSDYRKFLARAEEFLQEQGFNVVEIEQSLPPRVERRGLAWWEWALLLLLVLLLGIGIGVGWMIGH